MEHDFLKETAPEGAPAAPGEALPAIAAPLTMTPAHATIDPGDIIVGKFSIPPMTIRVARLLDRIESPFVVPQIDPETGKPMAVIPRITDITNALYIMLHQRDPRLMQLLSNAEAFERAVLDMCGEISMADMPSISSAIQRSISAVNDAAGAAGVEGSGQKKEGATRTS